MTRAEPAGEGAQRFRVSFVCTGNICRSPMAEVVLRSLAERAGLDERLAIESAATGDWHVGEQADQRTIDALARAGYDGSRHRARQFDPEDFPRIDLVVAFGEDTPEALIRKLTPNVLFKGADYAEHEVVGGDHVKAHGGKVELLPLLKGHSTTNTVKRMKDKPSG